MLSFVNDYCEGACPEILNKLADLNNEKNTGYCQDKYCMSATEKIRKATNCPDAQIFYLVGGTQTNQIVVDSMLAPYQNVISASTGHVSTHEAGAIEFAGHKVLTLPQHEGKIDPKELNQYLKDFYADGSWEHWAQPGMVYITHPTEYGTMYSKAELEAIRKVCDEYKQILYLDGARLCYGLAVADSDVTLEDIARLTDVFYIGGTKVGALFGEALVFTKNNMPPMFLTQVKQHGALLAKGFLLGLQYDVMFTDDLYLRLGKNAIETANKLRQALKDKGYKFLIENPTNQLMVVLENNQMKELAEKVNFGFWEKVDETHTAIRFCTSWATKMEDVDALIQVL
ncbi:MAG: aminotransferase class I/II-fold pyridoxal phosphate-dependent enzyme [Clostridia bacterium]|nr:aminotransferase class I/II-fold pyridoxal phosphate-dependent enzyme [Clostridia bacterium]